MATLHLLGKGLFCKDCPMAPNLSNDGPFERSSTSLSLSAHPANLIKVIRLRLWHWLLAPSAKLVEPAQQRQAAFLSGFMLGLILLALVVEGITTLLVDWSAYTGYRYTLVTVGLLTITYLISRTNHLNLAINLAMTITLGAIFISGWADTRGVTTGFFDYLILPLWLGSLFLEVRRLPLLVAIVLLGLLSFPLLTPAVTLNEILVGPFSFVFATALLLLLITHHRNRLEADRQAELATEADHSRRAAARADALLRIADRLNAQVDADAILNAIGEEVARAFNTPISLVALYDRAQDQLQTVAGVGLSRTQPLAVLPLRAYDLLVATLGATFAMTDLQAAPPLAALAPYKQARFRSIAFATMSYDHQLIGTLAAVTIDERRTFSTEELLLLQGLADQAAIAIENTTLFADLQLANEELSQAYESTIEGWSHALDLRDKETEGHTQRVTKMTVTLARAMGVGEEALVHIRRGALLHDIGKMGIPDDLLHKPGQLSAAEWVIMQKHPVYAYEFLSPIAYLRPALDIPYCHHEKWDGTGYPRGLKGEQIPFAARLFALVDVWDALCSDRPYRQGWPPEQVRAYIHGQAGLHFDPNIVPTFLRLLESLQLIKEQAAAIRLT